MEVPEGVLIDLKAIRPTFHFRWNERAALVTTGRYDATGAVRNPEYEGRWELWDTDPENTDYMVMRIQHPDGSFRHPGQWLVDRMRFMNPERWAGDVHKMLEELIDAPEVLREAGTERDQDDLIEMVGNWAEWVYAPKEQVTKSYDEMAIEHAAHQAQRAVAAPATPTP